MTTNEQALIAAIEAILKNHCNNDRLYCSTCTDARELIARLKTNGGAK